MKPAALSLAVLLATAAPPALAAEGGPIRTGEHDGFSRIVLAIEPSTEWSLELAPGSATLVFPGSDLAFTTEGVWNRMPRTRVTAITPSRAATGTSVRVELGCACRVSTTFVDARYLALDVHDRAPADAARDDAAAEAALAAAERLLVEQLERAADQGLIELGEPEALLPDGDAGAADQSEPGRSGPPTDGAPQRAEPRGEAPRSTASDPVEQDKAANEGEAAEDDETRLLGHLGLAGASQISAVTVFDRDAPRQAAPEPDPACRPDEEFDIARWSDGRALPDQSAEHRRILVGEFDRPNAAAILSLARLHIRHGLGAEAAAILDGFDAEIAGRELLADLARLVESRPAAGPLARDLACPGRHGLWLALAGRPAMLRAGDLFPGLRAAFEEMPPDLRSLIGPDLVIRFVEAGRPAEARALHDVAIRAGTAPDAAMRFAAGRLAAAEARLGEAESAFASLVERGATNAAEALLALVRTRLATGGAVPHDWITDLEAVALEHRGGPHDTEARLLAAEALAHNGEIRTAFATLAALAAESRAGRRAAESLAPRLLAEADPDRAGRAAFAETALEHAALLTPAPAHDAARGAIAAKLLGLGLANAALDLLAPALERGEEAARLLAARAHLALREGEAALARLDDLSGPEAAGLRARAQATQGDFAAAAAASAEAGAADATLAYAWAGGDWERAAASPDTRRAAMASYMRDRAAVPAAAPVPLTPEAAFATRPLASESPNLATTRSLLAGGRELQGFVESLLVE